MKESDSITYLKGVGEKRAALFRKLGIETVGDLLRCFPRDYTDFTAPAPIESLSPEETAVFSGIVIKKLHPYITRTVSIFKVVVSDNTDNVLITFFNSKYSFDRLIEGREYVFTGKIKGTILAKECPSPVFIDASDKNLLTPKYHLTEGLSAKVVANCVENALKLCETEDMLPEEIRERFELMDYKEALGAVHFPSDFDELEKGRRRLAFEELLTLQLGLKMMKQKSRKKTPAVMREQDMSDFFGQLSFAPTGAQMRSINECISDMKSGLPMNRLLQGDVGSGKTLVAAALCYFAAKNGYQSALMAPTEILAKQHADTLSGLLEPFGISVVLLTGSTPKKQAYAALSEGSAMVAVGTHAIIQGAVSFKSLGLVITDEQHRFGVEQRTILSGKGDMPHTLVMSATPIPRTLALVIYGDLEVSVLDEMPKGRIPIRTYGVTSDFRPRIYRFIRKYIENGFQAYIVCPRIEEDESSGKEAAAEYYERLKKGEFSDINIGLLHGKMKQTEKDSVMAGFKSGEIKLLVSTTVIEVGVDVPNAVIMVIENAEQFGLSQLHQLRGRVGRGTEQSHCILITDSKSDYTRARIDTMVETCDGFRIAEEDLRLRGPGSFFGARQHGLPELKIADMSSDISLLQETTALSEEILKSDPKLTKPGNSGLRRLVKNLFKAQEIYGVN